MDDIFSPVWSGNVGMEASLNELHIYSHKNPYTPIGENHELVWT